MKKKNTGQALVEFVLILPVVIMLIFGMIDFGRIYYTKSKLESKTTDIINMINKNYTYQSIIKNLDNSDSGIEFKVTPVNGLYYKLTVMEQVRIVTPGLNLVLDNPYIVKVERTVPYE